MEADEIPDCGRATSLSSTMMAIGRRGARSGGAMTPSRSEATQSAGIAVGDRSWVGTGVGSGVGDSDGEGEGESEGTALGVALVWAVPPALTTTSRLPATIAT